MLAVLRQSKHALRGPSTSLSRLISSNVASEDRDIVIVGGGPVGLALASALCQFYFHGYSVSLTDTRNIFAGMDSIKRGNPRYVADNLSRSW
jgi:hypothetical protein